MEVDSKKVKRKHPLANCEECPLYEKGKYVPTDYNGNDKAKYLLLGEAPGRTEARQGKPFVGVSGKLLDATMEEQSINKNNAVLSNVVLCQPPGNATPGPHEVKCCTPALEGLIEEVEPEYVVAMGNTASSYMMGYNTKITKDRVGPPKDTGHGYKVVPTVHPAACLRNPNLFPLFAADIGKLSHHIQIKWEPPEYKVFDDEHTANKAIKQLLNDTRKETLVYDLEVGEEKDSDFGHPNTLLSNSITYEAGKAIVFGEYALHSASVRANLDCLFQAKKLVCHNGKYDNGTLYRMGFPAYKLYRDTMLAAYTLDEVPGTKGLKYLGQEKLGAPDWDADIKKYTTGKNGSWHNIPKDLLYKYNAYDSAITWDLMEHLWPQMDQNDKKLHEFLCWASDQLMIIESEGIYIDQEELGTLEVQLLEDMSITKGDLANMIIPLAEHFDPRVAGLIEKNKGFNPNSPDQVKAVLELMLQARVTTTDAEMLELLQSSKKPGVQPFTAKMLTWRKISKLYGTYVKGIKERLDEDGRIRTSYLLHGTETGRLSSRNPNVQNQPRESKYANVRKIYAAEPGNQIIYADYGNIEGRIVAILSDDENMQAVLRDPDRDIHTETARLIYGENIDGEKRFRAKSVVHGKNYARTADGIAQGLGIPLSDARKISRAYDQQYPRVLDWHKEIKEQVLNSDEPLITPYGRKRRFGLITKDNAEDVYKEGLAFKPQGIASDICLTAGIRLKEMGFGVRILIHDGIVTEVPTEQVPEAKVVIREVMEQAGREYSEKVPFPVDIEVGNSWGEVD